MNSARSPIKEGDVYKTIICCGREFVVRYGFYSERERMLGEMIPILPDFEGFPQYNSEGFPYTTNIQDACMYYSPRNCEGDGWCSDCRHFSGREEIGICRCIEKQIKE